MLLPTSNLAAISPNADTLLVFGVGYDLRLNVASWSNPGPWAGPVAVGGEEELLAPHTSIAPNPFGDVALTLAGNKRLATAVFAGKSGSVAQWMSSDAREDPSIAAWGNPQKL